MHAVPRFERHPSSPTTEGHDAASQPQLDHLVTFYEDVAFFASSVSGFLLEGLRVGETVVIVATSEHRAAFAAALEAAGHDVDRSRGSGRYLELDAAETLAKLVSQGLLTAEGFEREIGRFVATTAATAQGLRIYGEMVALLWQGGDLALALELEDRWNALLDRVRIPLLCGYPLSAFDTPETTARFHDVCGRHTIVTTDSYASLGGTADATSGVVMLGAREPGGCQN